MNCTCPHHYGRAGLEKYGTDAACPAHGAPKAPPPTERPVVLSLSPKWCLDCGTEHAPGIECPDYD